MSSFEVAGAMPQANAMPFRRRVIQNQPLPPPQPQYQPPPPPVQTIPPWLMPNPAYYGGQPSSPPPRWVTPQPGWTPPPAGGPAPHPAGWPPAPEQPPMFTPPPAAVYPPASSYPPAAGPRSRADVADALYASPQPFSSPFSLANLDPESLPGLMPVSQAGPFGDPIHLPQEATFTEVTQTPWQQPKQRNSTPLAIAFIAIVLGACLWALKDDWLPVIMPDLTATIPNSSRADTAFPLPTPAPAVKTPSPEPEPEIRRAEVVAPPIDLVAAGLAGETLFTALMKAEKPEERLALIASPEEYATDVAEFFAKGKIDVLSFKPSNATLRHLPSQEIAPMFQVVTKQCTHGALIRVVPKAGGGFLLDWPLFAETHDQKLVKFIEAKATQPAWFQVCLRRDHGLELPAEERELQVSFTLQGSLDTSGKCAAIVQKNSSIGRYLSRETEWGNIYVARLLLQHRPLKNGTLAVSILDCEGAAAGATQ
jgi:hypothetical protein